MTNNMVMIDDDSLMIDSEILYLCMYDDTTISVFPTDADAAADAYAWD